jgi:hypothetical protein
LRAQINLLHSTPGEAPSEAASSSRTGSTELPSAAGCRDAPASTGPLPMAPRPTTTPPRTARGEKRPASPRAVALHPTGGKRLSGSGAGSSDESLVPHVLSCTARPSSLTVPSSTHPDLSAMAEDGEGF